MKTHRLATTLIELMVVLAIISILGTIGAVNYLHAQSRAKSSAVLNDLRLLSAGLTAYHMDNNRFPAGARQQTLEDYRKLFVPVALTAITTPVAYMSSLVSVDPFSRGPGDGGAFTSFDSVVSKSYVYVNYLDFAEFKNNPALSSKGYGVVSLGPDRVDSYSVYRPFAAQLPEEATLIGITTMEDTIYDPTNGVASRGDIAWFGGTLAQFQRN